MSGLVIVALGGLVFLVILIVAVVAYMRWHDRQPVPWTNSVMSGEMRSKLYPSANYRCCSSGDWVCTGRGCGSGSWADASSCPTVTYQQDSALSSSC